MTSKQKLKHTNLTKDTSSDKYEYIFPSYEFSKRLKSNYNGDYEIKSKGIIKTTIQIFLKSLLMI